MTLVLVEHSTLEDLATAANREYAEMKSHTAAVLTHAIACGEFLRQAREQVGLKTGHDGEGWTIWLSENTGMAFSQASYMIRLAVYKDQLPAEAYEPYIDAKGVRQVPSVSRAISYLKGLYLPPVSDSNIGRRLPQATRDEALRLHKSGVKSREIAELLSISATSVDNICIPGRARRANQNASAKRRREVKARLALREQEFQERRRKAAAAAGGPISDSYSLVRKLAQALDDAYRQASEPESRRSLEIALGKVHGAEDLIGAVLRVPRGVSNRRATDPDILAKRRQQR